jgi:hypothetical protein
MLPGIWKQAMPQVPVTAVQARANPYNAGIMQLQPGYFTAGVKYPGWLSLK